MSITCGVRRWESFENRSTFDGVIRAAVLWHIFESPCGRWRSVFCATMNVVHVILYYAGSVCMSVRLSLCPVDAHRDSPGSSMQRGQRTFRSVNNEKAWTLFCCDWLQVVAVRQVYALRLQITILRVAYHNRSLQINNLSDQRQVSQGMMNAPQRIQSAL